MHIALGTSLLAVKGYAAPEVEETYTRARQFCAQLDDPHQLFLILRGLWNYYNGRAEYQTAHALGEQLLTLAQQAQDPAMLGVAHRPLGSTLFFLGTPASAQIHFAQGIALYDPTHHRPSAFLYGEDAGMTCRSYAAWTLWCLGYPDQGLVQSHEAMTLAQQIAYPFSVEIALGCAAIFHQLRREERATQERTEATIVLAKEQGFPFWVAVGSMLHGWALAHQGRAQEGIAQITQSLMTYRAMGAEIWRPYFLTLLAEAYGTIGEPEAGLTVLAEALTLADTRGERWYASEIHRLKGALLLQQNANNQAEAENCFQQAITIAQNQQAKSFELRAATHLATLWQRQGKRHEAYALLAPVYSWFTEGFATADLQDAKTLLEALEKRRSCTSTSRCSPDIERGSYA
jgi:predicted ATPase